MVPIALLATLIAATSCEPDRQLATQDPSAPVEVWEVGGPAFNPIGELEEPATHVLFRPVRPYVDRSGRISVANARNEIRYYSLAGAFLGSIGGPGGGPGEFQRLGWYAHLPNGRVVAEDFGGRLVVFDSSGSELARSRLAVSHDPNVPLAVLSDTAVVGLELLPPDGTDVRGSSVPIPVRKEARLLVYAHDGSVAQVAGRALGPSWWVHGSGTRNGLPLGPRPVLAAHQNLIAVSDGIMYDARFLQPNRADEVHWVASDQPPRATSADLEQWISDLRASLERVGAPPDVPVLTPPFDDPVLPERVPGYWTFLFDSRGCLWAERYPSPGTLTSRWDVIDPAGSMIAHIDLPRSVQVSQVGDVVVGIERDDYGVPRIVGSRVIRPGPPRSCGSPFVS